MSTPIDEQQSMLDDCIERQSKLNEWEINFVDSAYEFFENQGSLTPKQCTKLEEIWERVTTNG